MFYLIKKLLKIIRFNSYGVFHTRYFDPNTLKIGMNVVVMSKVVLSENVYLGNHSEIYNNVHIGKNVKIGDYTSVNKYTLIDSGIIGNFTSIGPFVILVRENMIYNKYLHPNLYMEEEIRSLMSRLNLIRMMKFLG